jgi:signal transduction histidine kinase
VGLLGEVTVCNCICPAECNIIVSSAPGFRFRKASVYCGVANLFNKLFASLRSRLFLLVVLVCVPLAAVILYSTWDSRQMQMKGWEERSQSMMRLAGREEARLIGQTQQLLLAMAESSQVRSRNQRGCEKLLEDLISSYPRYANLCVLDTNGDLLASALPKTGTAKPTDHERGAELLVAKTADAPTITYGQFDHQVFHRVLQTRGFVIGDFPAGRTNGQVFVDFGYPVFDLLGQLHGVIIAQLDLDWVNRFESELQAQLPKDSTWTEVTSNSTILVRYPSPKTWTGRLLPETSLVKTIFGRKEGLVESPDKRGVPNLYAFATRRSQLVDGNVVAVLGIPKQVLFAGVDRMFVRSLVGLGIGAGLALLLGWIGSNVLILRRVKALVKSTARLGAGDLRVRTGLPHGRDELGQLTRTFDQMAQVMEHHESERELSSHKLQILSQRLVKAQETERRHIARELHDQIGQALTVAQMNLQSALQMPNGRERSSHLKECLDVVESTLEQVQDLSLNLRPSMLDDLGLEPALRWLTERQASLAELRFEVRTGTVDKHLDPMIKTECFRVAQEALTNIVRHAKAQAVFVELREHNGLLHLRVRDDGVGFDVNTIKEQAVHGASLGLLSMEERASLVGGGLEFKSEPGRGTEVHAWFPTRLPIPKPFAEVAS